MANLKYVGKAVTADPDLVYRDYVTTVKNADLSAEAIDQAINSELGAYASISYVDTKDGLLATQAYIDAQDNLRLKLAQKGVPNGIAQLDATGKVPPGLINAPLTQNFFRGPWSPAAYGSAANFTTESTIFTCGVTDPGYPYKLIVWGTIDAHINLDAEYPIFQIRVGNETAGEIIAVGNGASDGHETAAVGDEFDINYTNLGPDWEAIYTESGGGHAETDGTVCYWSDGGSSNRTGKFFRINSGDRYTGTNFQRINVDVNQSGQSPAGGGGAQHLRMFMRVNDARTQYLVWQMTHATTTLWYNNGSGEVQLGSSIGVAPSSGQPLWAFAGDPAPGGDERRIMLYKNGVLVGDITDSSGISTLGPSNRGWGFGLRAADRGFGQTTPPRLGYVRIADSQLAFEPNIIVPKDMTTRTGATTLYVRAVRSGASATGSYNPYRPKLHVMAVPA